MAEETPTDSLTLGSVLAALGSAVVSLQVAPDGTRLPIRSVGLLDGDDLAAAEPGTAYTDLCVLVGVAATAANEWVERLAGEELTTRPVALVIKDPTALLCRTAEAAGIAVGAMHAQARAEVVWSTVRGVLEGAARRPYAAADLTDAATDESDLYGLAQRVAALSGGLVSIEDGRARLLAYSATDGAADELRTLSILGREGPAEHLRRLRELGVYDRLRTGVSVVEVPADDAYGWRRRLVVGIRPVGVRPAGDRETGAMLGTIWIQEGFRALAPDTESVLQGAAAIAARLLHRVRSAPTQEALQVQRLLGLRGGGVDVPSLAAALALPPSGPAAVVGIQALDDRGSSVSLAELTAALRLLAAAYVRESLVTSAGERMYVLIPRSRAARLPTWVGGVLDRLTARFGAALRAAIAAPLTDLADVPAARAEVDRVLDRPDAADRVTTLTRSRTTVLLGEIADLLRSRSELADPRLQTLLDYDASHEAALVESLKRYLRRFGDVRAAAADLHIHPNTLRYRIRRAEQVLGMSLDDSSDRLLLQLQLLTGSGTA